MTPQEIFNSIDEQFDKVIAKTPTGVKLLQELEKLHEADIAQYLSNLPPDRFKELFLLFTPHDQLDLFEHLFDSRKTLALQIVDEKQQLRFLEHMSMDEFSNIVDFTNDKELKNYFNLLRKKDREKVLKLLKLKDNTVGTIMDINVVSLQDTTTVERGIHILQRLRPEQELHKTIYITDKKNKLVGYIGLEDLVLQKPKTTIAEFMKQNEYVARVTDDQEDVALQMRHYKLISAPVVSHHFFLGAVTASTLVDILEEEASEDILRISAMSSLKHTYFETPFFRLLFERGSILIILMLAESFTSLIFGHYEAILVGAGLMLFSTMLISTGGNTSTQTSAVVVQGLASGEIHQSNIHRFLRREFIMALCLATVLGLTAFLRVYYISRQTFLISVAVAASISAVVTTSVLLGSAVPFILKKIGMDPAYAAAPFLATGMDILGLFMYCAISQLILKGLLA